jgi:hypothetical protein
MSRITFKDDKYEVVTGWDPPLQYFHLTIYSLDDKDGDPVYDCLDEMDVFYRPEPDWVFEKLDNMGIKCPKKLKELMLLKEGNVQHWL